ncbi:MAG: arginase, partial [Lachnospiraceae bacterium]|nr:arginase [Lachnospiraceae bacterium]
MDICYMDFNDQYHILEKEYPGIRLELSQIPGTNCYCDDEAKKTIRKQMEQVPMECRVHFLDS